MSRPELIYSAPAAATRQADGIAADQPRPGYYRMRLRSGGVFVAIRIWFGPPHDPITGELLDRSWRWQATANGEPIDLDRVWPQCASDPISETEARHLVKLQRWGRDTGQRAIADPRQRVDPLTSPLMF